MLDSVIRFSLRHRPLVIVLALGALVYGGFLASTMPIDVFPDLDRPRVVILVECPGLSPEEVEVLVTQPMESVLLGATGVQAVRTQSAVTVAILYVEFDWKSDARVARQVVQERLATLAGALPEGIRPQMMPPTSIMGQIMHVGVHHLHGPRGGRLTPLGDTGLWAELVEGAGGGEAKVWKALDPSDVATWSELSAERVAWQPGPPAQAGEARRGRLLIDGQALEVAFGTTLEQQMELRGTVDWVLRPMLRKVRGVAEVIVLGGERKQYQALVDADALSEFGVTLAQVEQALRENNVNASGGFTVEGPIERPVRVIGRLGPLPAKVIDDLRRIPIKTNSQRNVLLDQVARIEVGPAIKRGDAGIDGQAGIVLTIVKQPHVDTRAVTREIKSVLRKAQASLPKDVAITTDLFQLKSFIDRGIYYVAEAMTIGAVLVIVILFLFLLNFRTTLITLTAIPLSLMVTAVVFRLIEFVSGAELSINVMTLGGIAVAMGELVDDAIVDVENIFRRLRENRALAHPRTALRVVYEASREIRQAIVFGTMVVILVFLPLFALGGIEGRLFVPLGAAYIVSILASLLVSLTVTPVLSYYLLPSAPATHRAGDGLLLRELKWAAARLVRFSMRWAGPLLLLTWLLVGLSAWQLTRLGTNFLPPFDEGSVQINVSLPPGSSLTASNDAAVAIDAKLRSMQVSPANPLGDILHFVRRTGRAEMDEHVEPVSRSEYILSMNPRSGRRRAEVLDLLLKELKAELPGVDIDAEQPLAHLISHMLSGVSAQIAIKVFGDDLDQLQTLARRIKAEIDSDASRVPGLATAIVEPQAQVDELHIVLRSDDLAFHGVSRAYVADFVQTALKGEVVSQVLEGQRRHDLAVRLQDPDRTDYTRLKELRLNLPDGRGQIKLGDVANLPEGSVGPNQVNREDARRRIVIRCNVLGRDLGSVVRDIQDRVGRQVKLPEGYFIEYGGQFESQRSATLWIAGLASVSLVGMFAVLLMLHPSVRIVLQILNAVPTAFLGGVLVLAITGQSLTVASLVGFVSLGGIAVRNGILLVTHYFHLMHHEGEGFTPEMVLRGSLERLSPVLMTALTAGIGLVPLVVGGHKPGLEILYPVATVILGGLITSTLCEFLIHPGLFWRFSGHGAQRLMRAEGREEL